MGDPVLLDSWMPVTNSRDVAADAPLGVTLLDTPIVLWRSPDGTAARGPRSVPAPRRRAVPRPGARRHAHVPVPRMGVRRRRSVRPPAGVARPDAAAERPARDVRRVRALRRRLRGARRRPERDRPTYFPEWDEPGVRQYHDEPVVVHACGPRIVENFLDMAHFPFVHAGVLGAESHTEVRDYTVTDERGRHRGHRLPVLAAGGDARLHGRRRRGVPLPGAPSRTWRR